MEYGDSVKVRKVGGVRERRAEKLRKEKVVIRTKNKHTHIPKKWVAKGKGRLCCLSVLLPPDGRPGTTDRVGT